MLAKDMIHPVCDPELSNHARHISWEHGQFILLCYLHAIGDEMVNDYLGEHAPKDFINLSSDCGRLNFEEFCDFLLAFAPDDEDDRVWGHCNEEARASWEEQAADAERRARAERKAAKQRAKATAQAKADVQAGASVPTSLVEISALNAYRNGWTIRGRVQLKDEEPKHLRLTIADISGDIEVSVDGPGGFSEDAWSAEDFASLCATVKLGRCYQISGGYLHPERQYNTSCHQYEIRLGAAGTGRGRA